MSWGEDPACLARVSRAFRIYYLYADKCLHPVGYAREIHFVKKEYRVMPSDAKLGRDLPIVHFSNNSQIQYSNTGLLSVLDNIRFLKKTVIEWLEFLEKIEINLRFWIY